MIHGFQILISDAIQIALLVAVLIRLEILMRGKR
jgi:hypothetical protein